MPPSNPPPPPSDSRAELHIHLDALLNNYRLLEQKARPAQCSAVVKANGYGLGAVQIVPVLHAHGCNRFWVATPSEGEALRGLLRDAAIMVFHGVHTADEAALCAARGLVPVLNHAGQLQLWQAEAKKRDLDLPAILHGDSGINRLGFSLEELKKIAESPGDSDRIMMVALMSHLACANDPDHPLNAQQKQRFDQMADLFPDAVLSLANSAAIFLGPDYLYDMVRPGIALYGGNPGAFGDTGLQSVVSLTAPILQHRYVRKAETVGYGATWKAPRDSRIGILPLGYADGIGVANSNQAVFHLGNHAVPLVGRVSMDLIAIDLTDVPEQDLKPGSRVHLLGPHRNIDQAAAQSQLLNYEVLTRIGHRFRRFYHLPPEEEGDAG